MKKIILAILCCFILSSVVYAETAKPEKTPVVLVTKTPATQPATAIATSQPVQSVVAAATIPTEATWKQITLRNVVELLFALLSMIAIAVANALLKKYKFETYTAQVDDIIKKAVGYAEQQAALKLKYQDIAVKPEDKLQIAIEFAEELAKKYKVKDKSQEWIEKQIESWLGLSKLTTH